MPGDIAAEPVIRLKDLTFSFAGAAAPVIDNISLEIGRGEVVAITGPSGCGKSTLAMVIGGYIPHAIEGRMTGSVEVCGKDTTATSLLEMAMLVGIVQQDPEAQLCTLSVDDEVAFGPENLALPAQEIEERVTASLAMAEASHLRGRSIFELSGGEKQRVAIASMLAMRPKVLILDEPTSNLDPAATADVFRAIVKLKEQEGMTIIVIEHKLSRAMEIADRMIVMEDGKLIMDGNPATIAPQYIEHLSAAMPEKRMHRAVPETGPESLRIEGLHFGYDGREVLRGITFRAGRGEIVGVMGKNGSGKTTFLTQILGFNKPDKGTVHLMGRDTKGLKVTEAARHAGYIFQNPNHQIFERTVKAEAGFACRNFGYAAEDEQTRVGKALDRYELSKYSDGHPLKLSFGEKRRLNLCSVLTYDPEVLILDEPTVGQDFANTAIMIRDLLKLRDAGKTVIFVTHDADMACLCCDRIIFFDDGRIIVDDIPAAAFKKMADSGFVDYLPGSAV